MKQKLNVLIAEDDFFVMESLKEMILDLNHNVIGEASNGNEAVNLINTLKPDLILMDINMPQLNGIEVLNQITTYHFIPCIVISGYSEEKLVQSASNLGVLYYMLKPVSKKELSVAIKITMGRYNDLLSLQSDLKETQFALRSRKYIEKAKGIIMDKENLKENEAMKRLQSISKNNNEPLINVAKKLIEAHQLFDKN